MPEGDTIHSAARRIGAALVGKPIVQIETPQSRHAMDRWPERLDGRAVRAVDVEVRGCFQAGVDPWRRLRDLADAEALAGVREIRPLMRRSADGGRTPSKWVFERTGLPCRRYSAPIRARGQGDDNRTTYWCPACQA